MGRKESNQTNKFSNKLVYWYFYNGGSGKPRLPILAPPPPPPLLNVSIFLFIFQSFGLYYSFAVSSLMNDLFQWENQVFKPTSLFIIVGWGKTGPAHSFPLLIFRSFYWLFSLSVYVTLSLYLNIYERHIQKRKSSFQSNKIIATSTLLGGKDWAGPFFPSSKMYWSIYLSFSL